MRRFVRTLRRMLRVAKSYLFTERVRQLHINVESSKRAGYVRILIWHSDEVIQKRYVALYQRCDTWAAERIRDELHEVFNPLLDLLDEVNTNSISASSFEALQDLRGLLLRCGLLEEMVVTKIPVPSIKRSSHYAEPNESPCPIQMPLSDLLRFVEAEISKPIIE